MNVDALQYGFMPGKGTTDALFVERMQKEYRDTEKMSCMCL